MNPIRAFTAILIASAVAMLFFSLTEASAAEAVRSQLLYENHCAECHSSVVHRREQRKASTREQIRDWVRRWQGERNLDWEPAEIDDVTEYLNDRFYRLETGF